jgi:hypothetical protein
MPKARVILFSVVKPSSDPAVGEGWGGAVLLPDVGVGSEMEVGGLVMTLVVRVVGGGVVETVFDVVETDVEGGVGEPPSIFVSVLAPPVSSDAISEIDDMIASGNFGTSTERSGSSQQDPDSAAC